MLACTDMAAAARPASLYKACISSAFSASTSHARTQLVKDCQSMQQMHCMAWQTAACHQTGPGLLVTTTQALTAGCLVILERAACLGGGLGDPQVPSEESSAACEDEGSVTSGSLPADVLRSGGCTGTGLHHIRRVNHDRRLVVVRAPAAVWRVSCRMPDAKDILMLTCSSPVGARRAAGLPFAGRR